MTNKILRNQKLSKNFLAHKLSKTVINTSKFETLVCIWKGYSRGNGSRERGEGGKKDRHTKIYRRETDREGYVVGKGIET